MKLIAKTIVIVLMLFGTCSAAAKQWVSNVNFNNPNNWDSGKTPCANSRIVFPETVTTVLLQTNISSVKEIVLPSNGEIMLPSDMVLSFADQNVAASDCDGGDVNFVRTSAESWFNPNNWQDGDNLVTVETERVPCRYDSVIFPRKMLFNVELDHSVTVGQMSFAGKDYDTGLFSSFLASEMGRLQFSTSGSSVTVQGSACPLTSGCVCGNDDEVLMNKICSQFTCLPVLCSEAVTPVGGCCPLCGSVLTMDYDPASFNLATFKQLLQDTYLQGRRRRRAASAAGVNTYISKTSRKQIQVVMTDSEGGANSGQAAIALADQIATDIRNDPGSFGVTSVSMESSKKGAGSQTGGLPGSTVAGIVIAIVIIVVIAGTLSFLVLRNRRVFYFNKDEPLHADVEGPNMPHIFLEDIPGQPPAVHMQSFDNPVYSTSAQENLYDDPTRVFAASLEPEDSLKGSGLKSEKAGPPPESVGAYDVGVSFANPNYADTGMEAVRVELPPEKGGAAEEGGDQVDLTKGESES